MMRARRLGLPAENVCKLSVFTAHNWTCVRCGIECDPDAPPGSWDSPELDHIVPFSRGGGHTRSNVQLLCHGCNRSKGRRLMLEWIFGIKPPQISRSP